MDKYLLGSRIKEARIARSYSIDDLALSIGVNKSTISRYERGGIDNPKLPVIHAIGEALHVNPSWLIGKSEDRTYTPSNSTFRIYEPNRLFSPLRDMRNALRLAPEDVAFEIGISKSDYLAIENGYNTDCVTLAKISMFYCCSADFALSFSGVVNEEWWLSFMQNKLFKLHQLFGVLPDKDQDAVINFAKELAEKNSSPSL